MSAAEPLLPPGQHGTGQGVTLAIRQATLHELFVSIPPGTTAPLHGGEAWWMAPGRVLLVDGTPPPDVIDQSGGFAMLRLGGPAASDVLARICRVELWEGSVARTPMAQTSTLVHRHAEGYDILVPSTLAHSFARHLLHLATGFGCVVLPPILRDSV